MWILNKFATYTEIIHFDQKNKDIKLDCFCQLVEVLTAKLQFMQSW